jgi:hypothetical protein
MLRRITSSTSSQQQLQLCLLTASATRRCVPAAVLGGPTRNFFDNLKKQLAAARTSGSTTDSSSSNGSAARDQKKGAQVPPGFPPGLNAQQMQVLQQLFSNQPKEKQEQLMRQAVEMQKMMSKVPGLGKFAQKNAAMMEQMLKMQQGGGVAAAAAAPSSSSTEAAGSTFKSSNSNQQTSHTAARRDLFGDAADGSARKGRTGPSLDELKRVNLGPEIEALFDELRTIRQRKNEYRDRYHTAQSAFDRLRKEHDDLATREASVRGKLAKAEQDVMLLTSENMELRDSSKTVKQLTQANKQLKLEVEKLKAAAQASAAPGTESYATLKQQQQASEDSLRSLQRKVDRMRRRDPLLQFSLACSDVSRLCASIRVEEGLSSAAASSGGVGSAGVTGSGVEVVSSAGQEAAEQAFAELQNAYQQRQQEAWAAAAHDHGAAAHAYVAVVRRYVMTRVPHANYDAVVSFSGSAAALKDVFEGAGFVVEAIPGEREKVHVVAAAEAEPWTGKPGPYGYAFALRLASNAGGAGVSNTSSSSSGSSTGATTGTEATSAAFTVTGAHPFVSPTLVLNSRRSVVHYEAARASGPGGQATNVTETQVYAKLNIDGVPAFTAEAQDSRSALSNKEAALEKLRQQRRQQYNDTLARQERVETVQASLVAAMRNEGGLTVEREVLQLVRDAVMAKQISSADAALVSMLQELSRSAAAAQ